MRASYIVVILIVLVTVGGCAARPPQEPPPAYDGPRLSFAQQDGALVFGPFASWRRNVDYFWAPDGQHLLVVTDLGEQQQLWLIAAATGDSRLLREAPVEVIFPIAWLDNQTLLSLDLTAANMAFAVTQTQWDAVSASNTTLMPGSGRVMSHTVTTDGRYVTIYHSGTTGGQVVRVDTQEGSSVALRQQLPLWDGLFPVWFAPGGRHAVLPASASWPLDLELVDILNNTTHTFATGLKDVDRVLWSPDGNYLAYKYADGDHTTYPASDMNVIISQKVRVHDTQGQLVWEVTLPQARSIGDLHWLGPEALLLLESQREQLTVEAAWTARLSSQEVRPSTPAEAETGLAPWDDYPMPRGTGSHQIEVEHYQEPGQAPAQLLYIRPRG